MSPDRTLARPLFNENGSAEQGESELASERRFRAVFNQAAVGIGIASMEGRFEEVNARFSAMLGYTPDELTGKTVSEITHPSDRAATSANMERLVRGEVNEYVVEKRFLHRDGSSVWGSTSVTLLRDAAHRPLKFVGIVADIGPRKTAQEALRVTAERLQLALSAGQSGDWSWDAGSDMVALGPVACTIFGLPRGTSITWEALRERLHPADRERARAAVQRAITTRSDYDIEYRITGETACRWIAAKGRAVYSNEGAVSGMTGVVQDITEQREAGEIRSRLAAVVESSDDAIISMNLDTTVTTWNRAAERIFGYTASEMIGRSVSVLIPPDSDDEEPVILRRLLDGERIDHYETIRMRKDGQRLNVSLTVSPILDGGGNIVGVSKISRDITSRKQVEQALRQAQEELRQHAEKLEDQVEERTARLRETIQELEAFSYSISHDMRSPLRAMHGYADALMEDYGPQLDATAQDYLGRIRRSAIRMDLLIQDVLAYSRVAKGEIQLRSVNLENVIRDVVQSYPALQPAHASITIVSPLPPVLGHEAYLTQVVSNFLGNAVKFVEPGKRPEVTISGKVEGDTVRITFRDNGIGIAPEHQDRIFQIFGRVYSEQKFEGTGIGLAIARKAAERMGGSVGVISAAGQGSEFFLLLKKT